MVRGTGAQRARDGRGAAARAALLADLLPAGAEPHLGVLLDNTPEYPLWLSAAALARAAVAGINPTRRGPELVRDILHTECRVLATERAHLPLLDGLDQPWGSPAVGVPPARAKPSVGEQSSIEECACW